MLVFCYVFNFCEIKVSFGYVLYRQKWDAILNIVRGLVRSVTNYTKERSQAHPLPRIGDVKRYLIRQRPHFIADFLIRSIIRTRLFNEYPQ